MKKITMSAVVAAALWCGQAYAIPIDWSVSGDDLFGHPGGTFTYDADSNLYSNVDITSKLFVNYTSGSGNASTLNMGNFFAFLTLNFLSPLTNAGGSINFTSSEGGLGFVVARGAGDVTGSGARSVPEPGTLTLLGAGLLGLGLIRRRRQAA